MRYLSFLLFVFLITPLASAGPEDRWVPVESLNATAESVEKQNVESAGQQFDGIALLLAIGAFSWVYVIYKDFKKPKRR